MKMTVKQWAIVIDEIDKACNEAEHKYTKIAATDASDSQKQEAWRIYRDLEEILSTLKNSQI